MQISLGELLQPVLLPWCSGATGLPGSAHIARESLHPWRRNRNFLLPLSAGCLVLVVPSTASTVFRITDNIDIETGGQFILYRPRKASVWINTAEH